jgi:hypothetical protein
MHSIRRLVLGLSTLLIAEAIGRNLLNTLLAITQLKKGGKRLTS